MTKTFEQACDEVAKKFHKENWELDLTCHRALMREAAELYATSKAQEAIKLAREKELVESDGFYKPRYDRKYTEEEILKIVGL